MNITVFCSQYEVAEKYTTAAEALAIHHEHRARDLAGARRYAESLRTQAIGQQAREAERRLARLDRKLKKGEAKLPIT